MVWADCTLTVYGEVRLDKVADLGEPMDLFSSGGVVADHLQSQVGIFDIDSDIGVIVGELASPELITTFIVVQHVHVGKEDIFILGGSTTHEPDAVELDRHRSGQGK